MDEKKIFKVEGTGYELRGFPVDTETAGEQRYCLSLYKNGVVGRHPENDGGATGYGLNGFVLNEEELETVLRFLAEADTIRAEYCLMEMIGEGTSRSQSRLVRTYKDGVAAKVAAGSSEKYWIKTIPVLSETMPLDGYEQLSCMFGMNFEGGDNE